MREEYDAAQWRNRFHPTGHFGLATDGTTAVAVRHGQYAFDQRSFECFRRPLQSVRAGAALPPRLHIVTSNRRMGGGDTLRPLPSGVFGQLQRRAARDLPLVAALLDAEVANRVKGMVQLHTHSRRWGVGVRRVSARAREPTRALARRLISSPMTVSRHAGGRRV